MKYIITIIISLFLITGTCFAQIFPNVPVDTIVKDNYYNYRSLVKYDANGYLHIVNTRQYDVQSSTREIFYRTNKTGSFVTTQVTSNSIDDNYATIDFDRNGKVHIGWERRDAGNNFQVIYTNNRNVSSGFGDSVWITTGGANKATPFMCAGKKDSLVHFVYFTFVGSVQDTAYYRNYNYVTGVLSPEYRLGPAEAGGENDIAVASDTNNVVHIFYATNGTLSTSALKYFTFQSGILTEVPTGVTSYVEYPEIVLNPRFNTLHIIYRQSTDKRIYLISRSSSGVLSTPYAITAAGLGNPSYWRAMGTDNVEGRLFVTYQNSTAPAPKGFFLVHGIPGSSFSPPITVWNDSVGYVGRGSSSVTAYGYGNITVAFDPTAVRNSLVCSDIYLKRGNLFPSSVNDPVENISGYKLKGNFPNPFNPSTSIQFAVPNTSVIKIYIFDITGREAALVLNKVLIKGEYNVLFDASGLPGGTYFCKLTASDLTTSGNIFSDTKSMIYVK